MALPLDVVIAEIIDTALVDEMFVPVMNSLWEHGVMQPTTPRLLFERYHTTVQLVWADHEYYGYTILAPKHEWPFYKSPNSGARWWEVQWKPASAEVRVGTWDFRTGPVDPSVDRRLELAANPPGSPDTANALLLRGFATLGDGQVLGAHNSFNGDKLLAIDEIDTRAGAGIQLRYKMGAGLHSLSLETSDGSDVADGAVIDLRGVDLDSSQG